MGRTKGAFMFNRPEDLYVTMFAERGRGDDEPRGAGDEDVRGVATDEDDDEFDEDELDEDEDDVEDI
jgi:hypothetical protein